MHIGWLYRLENALFCIIYSVTSAICSGESGVLGWGLYGDMHGRYFINYKKYVYVFREKL